MAATGGNPLALTLIGSELSVEHPSWTVRPSSSPLPIGRRLEAHYLGRGAAAPEKDTRAWLILAAAEPAGDPRRPSPRATVVARS